MHLPSSLQECSPDKRADLSWEMTKYYQRQQWYSSFWSRLETAVTTTVVLATLFIWVHPGANFHSTQRIQAIRWLYMGSAPSPQPTTPIQPATSDPATNPIDRFPEAKQRIPADGESIQGYIITDVRRIRDRHPITGQRTRHEGFDMGTPHGTNLLMPRLGSVECKNDPRWGPYAIVKIDGLTGSEFVHHHLSVCTPGDRAAGQIFAKTGTAGTGPHWHFEWWKFINGEWENFEGKTEQVNGEWKPVDIPVGWFEAFLSGKMPE